VSQHGVWEANQNGCQVDFFLHGDASMRLTGHLDNGNAFEGLLVTGAPLGTGDARCCGAVVSGRVYVHCEGGCRLDLGEGGREDGAWPYPGPGCGRTVTDTSGGSGTGASCNQPGDCASTTCGAFYGGYCTAACPCSASDAVCADSTESGATCARRCAAASDCARDGYACVGAGTAGAGACLPDCRAFGDWCVAPRVCNCRLGACQPPGTRGYGERCDPAADACDPDAAFCIVTQPAEPGRGVCSKPCFNDQDCDPVGGVWGECTVHRPEGDLCGWRCALGERCPDGWSCDSASGFCLPG
jgi:hypothetical protein